MEELKASSEPSRDFGTQVVKMIPGMIPYVKHRLYRAELSGIIPKNMYKPQGVIDEAVVSLYETCETDNLKGNALRLKLFTKIDDQLNEILKKESFHKDTLSISQILEKELETLEEHISIEADDELIMQEELDDISYHQKHVQNQFLYDDAEKYIIDTLGLTDENRDAFNQEKRYTLHRIYQWLPYRTANIMDMYIFGKLSVDEIAEIQHTEVKRIDKVLQAVRKSFRKNLE